MSLLIYENYMNKLYLSLLLIMKNHKQLYEHTTNKIKTDSLTLKLSHLVMPFQMHAGRKRVATRPGRGKGFVARGDYNAPATRTLHAGDGLTVCHRLVVYEGALVVGSDALVVRGVARCSQMMCYWLMCCH